MQTFEKERGKGKKKRKAMTPWLIPCNREAHNIYLTGCCTACRLGVIVVSDRGVGSAGFGWVMPDIST